MQFKLEAFELFLSRLSGRCTIPKSLNVQSLKESDLTLHRRACGLREEWNKQEIDEVEEGQGIVPEQASCRDKDTSTDSIGTATNHL